MRIYQVEMLKKESLGPSASFRKVAASKTGLMNLHKIVDIVSQRTIFFPALTFSLCCCGW